MFSAVLIETSLDPAEDKKDEFMSVFEAGLRRNLPSDVCDKIIKYFNDNYNVQKIGTGKSLKVKVIISMLASHHGAKLV